MEKSMMSFVVSLVKINKELGDALDRFYKSLGAFEAPAEVPAPAEEKAPVADPDGGVVTEGRFTREELDAMKYNDLKKLAAFLEVPCSGTRNEITERMLALKPVPVTVEKGMEEEPEEKVAKKSPLQKKDEKKPLKAKKDKEPEIPQKWVDKAKSAMEDTDRDEVIEVLRDSDVEVEDGVDDGKLLLLVAKAFMDGKLEDDDEEEEESPAPAKKESPKVSESKDDDEGEVDAGTYFKDYDKDGVNDPANNTKARNDAMIDWQGKFLDKYDDEEVTLEEVTKDLTSICTQDELDALGDDPTEDEIVPLYIETMKRHIDDEGTMHEGGDPYEISGNNFCCGHSLSEIDGDYVCEVCGTRYEA